MPPERACSPQISRCRVVLLLLLLNELLWHAFQPGSENLALEPIWQHRTAEELQMVEEDWPWINFQLDVVEGRKLALINSVQKAFVLVQLLQLNVLLVELML